MKKLFLLGALFAAGLTFTACSDKDSAANDPAGKPEETAANGYIALSVNLPTTPAGMTRAGEDNNGAVSYDDGLDGEYEVKDATLIVFGSTSPYSVKAFYELSKDNFSKTSATEKNVTSSNTKIIQLVGTTVSAGDLALVILNKNGLNFGWSSTDKFQINGTDVETYAAFQATTFAVTAIKDASHKETAASPMKGNGFYMANAPLADTQGSTTTATTAATVRTLVPITTVYKTYAEAEAGAADQIYVERGMAKVTMTQGSGGSLDNSKVDGTTTLNYSLTAWTIDNANPTSYLVRSTDGYDGTNGFRTLVSQKTGGVYRYIGNQQITYPTIPTFPYRTYFAKSTNYDGSQTLLNVSGDEDFSTAFGNDNPQYCFENTFSVDKMTQKNTTLVQLKVTAKTGTDAEDLYTIGGNKTHVYNQTSLIKAIQEAAYNYISANDAFTGTPGSFSTTDIEVSTSKLTGLAAGAITEDQFADGLISIASGKETLIKDTYRETSPATNFTDATEKAIYKYLGEIVKYKGGVSYYNIRIKHFGNDLTPWNDGEYATGYAPTGTTIATIYPGTDDATKANNYLGRYGVLRNNWYNLAVSSIRYLGDATPHTTTWPDTPDDELESYITFQINVLSWAKREQSEDL